MLRSKPYGRATIVTKGHEKSRVLVGPPKSTSLLPPLSTIPPFQILFTYLFHFLPYLRSIFYLFSFYSFKFYYILLHFVSIHFILFQSTSFRFISYSFRFISYFSRTRVHIVTRIWQEKAAAEAEQDNPPSSVTLQLAAWHYVIQIIIIINNDHFMR